MLTYGVVLHHDNAPLHTAAHTQALLQLDHTPYRPNLTPSDYHLFTLTYLKNWLGSQRLSNYELMEGVKMYLSSKATDFFDTGIQKLIPRYDKCFNSGGDYVQK
jgi:hypothetical protein